MGYEGNYSLNARCASEILATGMAVYLALGAVANALLPGAKGQGMGFGWMAFAFGLSFIFPVVCFGHISAMMNPALALAELIKGDLSFRDFVVLSLCELIGAMGASILLWLFWLPHFKTVPEPPALHSHDMLLRRRDALSKDGLNFASYQTEQAKQVRSDRKGGLRALFKEVVYYVNNRNTTEAPNAEDMEQEHPQTSLPSARPANRPSFQLDSSTMRSHHSFQQDQSTELAAVTDLEGGNLGAAAAEMAAAQHPNTTAVNWAEQGGDGHVVARTVPGASAKVEPKDVLMHSGTPPLGPSGAAVYRKKTGGSDYFQAGGNNDPEDERLMALYDAAVIADQNAKLSIFATRPGIYAPVFNFFCEFLNTVILVTGILLFQERGEHVNNSARDNTVRDIYTTCIVQLYIGLFIAVLFLSAGGTTALSANPARDLGPRIIHWILPIPNKGPSEWYYGWIPVFAAFAGGAAGGGIFLGIKNFYLPF